MSAIRLRAAACILDGDRLLLVVHEKKGRRYHLLPGGGVEMGETIAQAVEREVREETGLEVVCGPLVLLCEAIGDDDDGLRHVVQVVHAARVVRGTLRPGCDGRLVDCAWVALDDLPGLTLHPPIAGTLVEMCAEGLRGPVRSLGNVHGGNSPA